MVVAHATAPISAPEISRKSWLHVFSSFGIGGVPLRTVDIINHFGTRFGHSIVALDSNFAASSRFDGDADIMLLPMRDRKGRAIRSVLDGALALRRLRPDLLVTYGWGAIEWAMANRLLAVAPHYHFEDGFGRDEADVQLPRRVLFRRLALARCDCLVVPSRHLEEVARRVWKLPADRIVYVPNGVDLARFAGPLRDAVPGFSRRPGELVIGTVAPLRPEKNIGRLLQVFAALEADGPVRLIVAGDGSERAGLERQAHELGIAEHVVFTGQVRPEAVLGAFDIFTLSSDTEQMPIVLLEAMAASRAVVAVDVGDIRTIVCEANRPFVVPRDDRTAFAAAFRRLLGDPSRRRELGEGNRQRVVAEFSQQRMFAEYEAVFGASRAH
jgi:glycosyltransferase involved in cell wall biosynthesis